MQNVKMSPKLKQKEFRNIRDTISFFAKKSPLTLYVRGVIFMLAYTLNLNKMMSPSFTTYSLPSERTRPFSFAAVIEPFAIKSS